MTQYSPLWPYRSKTESIPTPETVLLTIILIWLIFFFHIGWNSTLSDVWHWLDALGCFITCFSRAFTCYQTGCFLSWITLSLLGGWDQRSRSFKITDQQFANFLVPGLLYTVKSFWGPQKGFGVMGITL